jgi:hypothetical protein
VIEVHDGTCSADVSEYADAAAEADALATTKLAFAIAVHRIVRFVCLPPDE